MLALALFAGACQNPTAPSFSLDELLTAPVAIDIDGRTFTLETYVWRDFMPPSEPAGSLLAVVVYLTAVDGQPFPGKIDATRLWVVHGQEIWETTFVEESRPRSPARQDQLEKSAAGGPRWDVGAEVDVVVRVTVSASVPRLLRATKQMIGKTV